jgi:heptosyltransferase-2
MEKRDVLIIKTGYSEVLDIDQNSIQPSYGDILRTTPILHNFKGDNVTWLTDKAALPLLENNPFIKRALPLDFKTAMHLLEEDFDVLINFEKNHDICKFSDKINAWSKYGFRFDNKKKKVEAYDRASEAFAVSSIPEFKKENKKKVQELLFEMVGSKWDGEGYVLGYQPKTSETYDVLLNTLIGQKWSTKAWPKAYWDKLEELLEKDGLKVTRQDKQDKKILTNLYDYMDWINSSKLVVSNDSLGMHLAICFKKKVLALFGSTPSSEVCFYGLGKVIFPNPLPPCLPCFNSVCKRGKNCMEDISPEEVHKEIIHTLSLSKSLKTTTNISGNMIPNSKFFIDGSKLNYHPLEIGKWLKGEQIYPIHVEISPSSGCNHRCVLCCVAYKQHKPNNLSKELMIRLMDDFKEAGVKSFLLAGEGEPLLNPYCVDLLLKAKENGIDAALTTNGVLFTPAVADKVSDCLSWNRFSIQSHDPKKYAYLHGTSEKDYYKVIENIKHAVKIKKERNLKVKIGIQQILINENWDSILELAKLSKELGVDYFTIKRFSKHQNNNYDVPEDLWKKSIPQMKEAEKLSDDNFSAIIRWNQFENQPREYTQCIGLPFITQILATGEIYPCCQFFDNPKFCFGNLYEKTFKQIFDSENTKEIMKWIQEKYDISKCMTYCRHHSTNLFLHGILNKPEHMNFI